MKKKLTLVLAATLTVLVTFSQSISPNENTEFCPLTDVTFTVTLPRIKNNTQPNVSSWTNTPIVVSGVSNLTNTATQTTFTFVGRFRDVNIKQEFKIDYVTDANPNGLSYIPSFKRIKSLFYSTTCAQVPNQATITVPRCQVVNIPVNVSNVQWGTFGETPTLCFGSISTFEYQMPSGWSIGASVSNGTNWIAGGNSVTVTSDLATGDGGVIRMRPRNSCGAGLQNGQTPGGISISRSRPTLSITGDNFICSGSKTYSISGTLPPGATVCWSSSNTNYATVPASPNNCGTSIPVSYVSNGVITLTATITDCIETYTVTKDILIGAAVAGYYRINSNYHNYGIFNPLYGSNSSIWLPANQGFGVDVWLNSPGIQSATWTRASNSYPFSWTTSGTFLSFSGTSGPIAYEQRNGIFNLSAQTVCGGVTDSYTWPIIVQGWGSFQITISPNPATDVMTLSISEESPEVKALSKGEDVIIQLYTFDQGRMIKQWKFKNDQKQFSLKVADVQKGQYIIVVKKGKFKESKQVRIGQ